LRSRGFTVTTGISGSVPSETTIKPISSLVLGTSLVEPRKAVAILVATEELLKQPGAEQLFNSELTGAVVAATDSQFLTGLIAATTPTASAGALLANIVTDLSVLLSAITNGPNSKIYFIVSPTNAKKLALKASSIGSPAFPNIGPNGGEIIPGVTMLVTDQIPSATAIMLAADAVAGNADTIVLDGSRQAILQLQTTPDSPVSTSTIFQSLWQTNEQALRAERFFGFTVVRASGVASLSGVAY
jgi:HK97 family phage major capsid protein